MAIFRRAVPSDLSGIMEVVSQAQRFMAGLGIDQWQDGYPSSELIAADIEADRAYVMVEDGNVASITVLTAVETDTPVLPPSQLTKNMVLRDASAMFTMLLPMRMLESSSSYRSAVFNVLSAFLLPWSAKLFSRVLFSEENDVSVAEKKADSASRITMGNN